MIHPPKSAISKSIERIFLIALLLPALCLGVKTASVTGNWNSTATWGGAAVPGGADDIVINTGITVTLVADYTTSGALTLNLTGTIQMASFDLTVGSLTASGAAVINNAGAADLLTVGGNNATTTYTGIITNQITLVKNGSGTLTLGGGTDNGSLGVTVNAGTLLLAKTSSSSVHAVGGGGVTIAGGTVKLGGSGGDQIYNPASIMVNSGTFDMGGFSESVNNISGSGTIDNTAGSGTFTLTIGANNGSSTFSGVIKNTSQTLALTKSGSGTTTLSGANTYAGATTVSSGNLSVTGSTASGSAVSVASGATLAGSGTVAGTVTIQNGGILSPGISGEATINTGTLVLGSGSVLDFTLGAGTASDEVVVTGNLTLDGTINITAGTGFTDGNYTPITYSGILTDNTLAMGALPNGYTGSSAGAGVVNVTFDNAFSGWSNTAKVYVNTAASGANITSDQSNFPMLVRLNQGNFNFSQANSDGSDLRFADSTGAYLAYETERFDAANKLADVWVLLPTVKANNNSQWFKMYWGNSNAASLSSPDSVFQIGNGFKGVWHWQNNDLSDATSNGNDLTNSSTTNQSSANIAGGRTFSSAGLLSPAVSLGGAFTLSAWVKPGSPADIITVCASSISGASANGFRFFLNSSGTSNGTMYMETGNGTTAATTQSAAGLITYGSSVWYYLTAAVNRTAGTATLYKNGLQVVSGFVRTDFTNTPALSVGKMAAGGASNYYYTGDMDEMEVSTTLRSDDWIKLSYESQKAGSTVISIGARPSDFTSSVRFNFNTTATGANVTGTDVANIPILVRLTSSNFDFSRTTNTGSDIQFIDRDGTYLYHEVVEWDKANSVGKVWVKVPQVDKNSTTDYITLYYGCAACLGSPYAVKDSVWNGYKGVFHLNAPEDKAYDASTLANHGTYAGGDQPNVAGLTSNNALYFDGTTNYIDVPNESNYDITANFSVSAWIKVPAFTKGWQALVTKGDNSWRLHRNNVGSAIRMDCTNLTTNTTISGSTAVDDNAWHYVAGVYDGSFLRLYLDGASDATALAATGSIANNAYDAYIGENAQSTGRQWNGAVSEVRIGNTAGVLSADFIKLSYQNQKANSTLFSTTTITTASFQKSKVFKLNTTASGANIAGDVYNFPLLLRITGSTLCDAVQASAPDIRFLDGDGVTWLDYQVERWDQSVDSAEVWVKVPKISGNSASGTVTMYYQQASGVTVPDGQCASCVFSPGDGYAGVWHLSQAGNTTANNYVDATGNGYHGTGTAMVAGNQVSALVGKGQTFDGSTQWISLGTAAGSSSTQTVSFWMKATSLANTIPVDKNPSDASGVGWTFKNRSDGSTWYRTGSETSASDLKPTGVYTAGNWVHIAGTFDASGNFCIYSNGALLTSGTSTKSVANSTTTLRLGIPSVAAGTEKFAGTMDEVEISSAVRDSNWIKLEYQNQRAATPLFNPSPADFVSTRKYTFNTTKTGANVMNNVTNFPLLVRIRDVNGGIVDAVQASAPDIRFLDGDGKTWLNYSIERWDKTLDSAEVWVLVPQVDGNSDHDFITLYYNDVANGTVADGQCANCVFGTDNGFAAAWHLNNSLLDETANSNNGTNQGSANGEGVSAAGRSFSGTAQYATFGNANSLKNITSAITVEAWLKTSQAAGGVHSILRHDSHFTPLQITGTAPIAQTAIWNPGLGVGAFTWNGVWNDNTWQHFVTQYDNVNGLRIYRNGTLYLNVSASGDLAVGTLNFAMGGTETGAELYTGNLDEVRVSNVARDSNWIRLSYHTQLRTGNVFWNSRAGPDNLVSLTATAGSGNIALSWNTPVSDSSNADSVGLWVKYAAYPDSANAASATRVVQLAKTDSAYTYPAAYSGTYYFALAVRNSNGAWSPFTTSSSDTAVLVGSTTNTDTVYVDSAIGLDANSCTLARNPATPKLTITSAVANCTATDTLVVRAMPGTYANDNSFTINAKPTQIASFDNNSRAVLSGSGSVTDNAVLYNYTVAVNSGITLRNMNVKAGNNNNAGVYLRYNGTGITLDGCRIYNNGSTKNNCCVRMADNTSQNVLIANNLCYQPTTHGIDVFNGRFQNIVNNVFYGSGGSTEGITYAGNTAYTSSTVANNIFYNWNYGIRNTFSSDFGLVSNNLFYQVTSGQEVSGETDNNRIIKDPLFYSTDPLSPKGFKPLPGSPAIDAGTSSLVGSGYAVTTSRDAFGTARPQGAAPDIGLYEGAGYTPNPSGEFDTLTTSYTATTTTVENGKWKIIFDKAGGGGINLFYDKTTAPSTNLLAAGSTLFDAKIDAYTASAQASIFAPTFLERTRARATVRQRLAVSASLDLNIYYTVYPSGHIYIQSELSNLGSATLAVGTVDYTLKLGTTTSAFTSGGAKNGFGYLNTATRDALLSVTGDLDGGASSAETWSSATAASGSPGTVVFKTANLVDIEKNMTRRHPFLLYIGDNALDFPKSATLNIDAYNPSVVTASAGSLVLERSWQMGLNGHWTFDEGAGPTARDKAVFFQNNAAITGANAKFVSGKVGGALYLTATDEATVTDNNSVEATIGATYLFWLKPDFAGSGTTAYIISKGTSTSNGWFVRKESGLNKITFNMGAASVTSPALTDGVWTHIAVSSHGASDLEMYVNGVQAASSIAPATAVANASDLLFGYNTGAAADKFQGTLDDIRIYNNEISQGEIQAIYNRGFSGKYGHYALRADNNNRIVALLNGGAAQTRVQPAFKIDNWYGPNVPKYVYLNGVRLIPNTDFVVDSVGTSYAGSYLVLQLNKVLTGADQTLFIDDDDSTGFLGAAGQMKALTVSSVAGDKLVIQNFSDTVFGASTSGQWHLELDLNGWAPGNWTASRIVDTGFGEFNVWKDAAIDPNVAVSGATNQVGIDLVTGRTLTHLKFDNTTNPAYSSGAGYNGPANITYTLADSSSTRLSLVLTNMSMQCSDGTFTLSKRWTVYPTGRIFGSFTLSSQAFDMDSPALDLQGRYNVGTVLPWGSAYAKSKGRWGLMGGDQDFHSYVGGILGVKNLTSNYDNTFITNADSTLKSNTGGADYRRPRLLPPITEFTSANNPITVNFMMDISKDFTDSATADSLMADVQTPAVLTAITGTRTTSDGLDFNGDNFAEGDGAYTYAAASGIVHFKFVNAVTAFNPVFRINTWTQGTLPEFVELDNQVLTKGYQYNAYLNATGGEVIIQFNKTLAPGTHIFYISHKNGLAVTLRAFEAKGGEGVDTLAWTTESEFENLGYHLYRRLAPAGAQIDSGLADGGKVAAAGPANALMDEARTAFSGAGDSHGAMDTLASQNLIPEELAALGYVRITPRLIPGAKSGSSASTLNYSYIDRTAEFGADYEYLLEAVDFNGGRVQYGPRTARPFKPLATELYTNYPNPFNPITTLRFSLKDKSKVSLLIYDSRGRLVRILIRPDKAMMPGKYRLIWDAKNESGFEAPSGQYFYRFTAGRYVKTRKMILMK
ncbi:MAG: Fibronectin type domain protein [Fibrobacteres bacterium]|nr:Fibronectin type domain protein [Fibrobacterota bacterium]